MKALFATDYSHGARVARELLASLDWPRGTAFRVVTAYEPLELFGAPMIDVLAGRTSRVGVSPARCLGV